MTNIAISNEHHYGDDKEIYGSVRDIQNTYKTLTDSFIRFTQKWNAILYAATTVALVTSIAICFENEDNKEEERKYLTIITMLSEEETKYYSPSKSQLSVCWCILWTFQGLFAFLPLIYKRENFINVCCGHIGTHFIICQALFIVLVCALLIWSVIKSSNDFLWWESIIVCAYLFIMKAHIQIGIYSRVKYLDEGQDYVGCTEFCCIHVNFAIYSCILSFYLLDAFFFTINKAFGYVPSNEQAWESNIICIVMISESFIYLARYKDLVYGLFTCQILAGIMSSIITSESKEDEDGKNEFSYMPLWFVIIEILSVILTLIYHHKSAVYIKYKDWAAAIYGPKNQVRRSSVIKKIRGSILNPMENKLDNLFTAKDSMISNSSKDSMSVISHS